MPQSPGPGPRKTGPDWESLVGIRLFSWIAGIALVLAAVFLFKYSVEHGWLRPAVRAAFGLITGTALLVVCELRVARNYRFTANAMLGAGIAILYATLFAMHGTWRLIPAAVAFGGMLLVTAAAVYLSTRRDSVFIALLGLIGGFATPALLSTNENRPLALFSYLLLLNGGISWIAYRKRWPLLTALSVALTAFYQWAWVEEFLTKGQLPLAAGIFGVFALVGVSSLWDRHGDERQRLFRVIAQAAAVLPLIFAFFTAVVPEYGARYNVLFGFLLLMAAGLAAIAHWRGPGWLHHIGGAATVITFFIWLSVSYTRESWPWSLLWLALFVALYLVKTSYAAAFLFFAFTGLAIREKAHDVTLTGAMLALLAAVLAVAILKAKPLLAATALALSSIALMSIAPPLRILLVSHAALFAAILLIAWLFERHWLAVLAIPFYIAMMASANMPTDGVQLAFAFVPYAMFIAYPLLLGARAKSSIAPYLAACLASGVFFAGTWDPLEDLGMKDVIGLLPLAQALVLAVVLWRLLKVDRNSSGRAALVAGTALAFITAAIPMQFTNEWTVVAWALEAAALAWLFTRIPHRGLLAWSAALAIIVLLWLLFDSALHKDRYASLAAAAAMFVAAYFAPSWRGFFASIAIVELFWLMNLEIAAYYSTSFSLFSSSLAQDLTYTVCWTAFAIAMLVGGIALHARGARIAALGLLVVTILKCFLHDLARLGGLYRVASFLCLAVALVLVGLLLQKFVIMKAGDAETSHAPSGTT